MIQKTASEKALLKAAKQKNKESERFEKEKIELNRLRDRFLQPSRLINQNQIFEGEDELSDTYPVYWDSVYVVQTDEKIRVIRSDVQGNIITFKQDLMSLGITVLKVFSCNLRARLLL